jgi:hypothetical protein
MTPLPELTIETLWDILHQQLTDELVNQLLWHYLGYRYETDSQTWDATQVAPDWREKYPEPPDFVGSRPATVQLTRSIPAEDKQLLKDYLGFKGYTVAELNPTLTRRATATSWLLSYMKQQGLLP